MALGPSLLFVFEFIQKKKKMARLKKKMFSNIGGSEKDAIGLKLAANGRKTALLGLK